MDTVVRLCGPLIVRIDGADVSLPGRQGRLVFAYLARRRPRPSRRDQLVDALWPHDAPASADATLTSVLSRTSCCPAATGSAPPAGTRSPPAAGG